MSFRTKMLGLSSLIVVLAVLYGVGFLFNSQTSYTRSLAAPLLGAFKGSLASRIELSGGDKRSTVLERKNDGWFVAYSGKELPASSAKVQTFLDSVANLTKGKLASSDSRLNAEFSLTPALSKSIVVLDQSGKKIADILVGKTGASGFEDYLRLASSNDVHLTRSSLNFYLAQERSYWYDLAVLPDAVTGTTITEIRVSGEVPLDASSGRFVGASYDIRLKLSPQGSEWISSSGTPALDQRKTQIMVNRLALLQGVDFLLSPRAPSTESHRIQLVVTTADRKSYTIDAWPSPDGSQYVVTTSVIPFGYVVNAAAFVRAVVPLSGLSAS